MKEKITPKIGLALGSGGARGLSHIGVIKILKENNIPIDFIAGSSIGALVGGFYASGMSIEDIEKVALDANWKQIFSLVDLSFNKSGLVEGEKVKKFIKDHLGKVQFEDCLIPFKAVATDLKNGNAVVFDSGEMGSAIRASISVPLFFKPVKIGSKLLYDGGLSKPVPVDIAREMGADIVIAVNINGSYSDKTKEGDHSLYTITQNSIRIMNKNLAAANIQDADIVVTPIVGDTKWNEFVNGKKLILAGEEAANRVLLEIKKKIESF